jgi:hypothetical protein
VTAGRCVALIGLFCYAASALHAQANADAAAIIRAVNIDTLSRVVRELTGEVPVTINGQSVRIDARDHTTPVNWAAEYLCRKMESYGYRPVNQHYGVQGRNIYTFSNHASTPSQYFILSSHYDAFPYIALAPGADDDISGVAIVLEAARLLKATQLRYGLMFAFWDEEEVSPGMFGSRHFADSVALAGDEIQGVINLELLGWDGNGDDAMTVHTRPIANSPALAQAMLSVNDVYAIGLHPTLIDPGDPRSDHSSFWEHGYGALMQLQDMYADPNPGYHSYRDVFSAFNLSYYHKMARLAIGTILQLTELTAALPVELSSFSVKSENGIVRLRWRTETETNTYGFDVEKRSIAASAGGADEWKTIGSVAGHGTSTQFHLYEFEDAPSVPARIAYRLKQIDRDGSYRYSEERRIDLVRPLMCTLLQNYPNPFNPSTLIVYETAASGPVRLSVYDVLGRLAAVLVDEPQDPGRHALVWNALGRASGVYLLRLESEGRSAMKSMLLLR